MPNHSCVVFAAERDLPVSGLIDLTSEFRASSPIALSEAVLAKVGVKSVAELMFFTSTRACSELDSIELWQMRNHTKAVIYHGNVVGFTVATVGFSDGRYVREDVMRGPSSLTLIDTEVIRKDVADTLGLSKGWTVACPCYFKRFDYVLTDLDGKTEVVERRHDNAHLSRSLVAFGGSGISPDNKKVGRLLKYLAFGEKTLVRKAETTTPTPRTSSAHTAIENAIAAVYEDDAGSAEVNLLKSKAQQDVAAHFAKGWR